MTIVCWGITYYVEVIEIDEELLRGRFSLNDFSHLTRSVGGFPWRHISEINKQAAEDIEH